MPASKSSVGKVNAIEYNIQWSIDKFCGTCMNSGAYLLSPVFSINYNNQVANFIIQLYPSGTKDSDGKHMAIYLHNQSNFAVITRYQFSLIDNKNRVVFETETGLYRIFKPGENWGISEFAELDFVIDPQNGILNNKQLIISCLMKIGRAPKFIDRKRKYEEDDQTEVDRLVITATHNDFRKMFETGVFSDVTVSTAESKKFHLHKCVLASRSTVFQAMLNSDMIELKQNSIVIEDFSYEIMKELFRFMYTGKVQQIGKIADGLLKAAHKYCVGDLTVICEKILCQNLTIENVLEYLALADLYCAKNLKTRAIKFIISHGRDVVNKPDFKTYVNLDTACEIINAFSSNIKE